MIRVFCGDDRVKIQAEIRKVLGEDYEVFDGENLDVTDIYDICRGNSLFSDKRKILIKDLTPAKKTTEEKIESASDSQTPQDFYEVLGDFVDTKHEIVIWESVVSQKKSYKDFIKNKKVEMKKFAKPEVDKWAIFRIIDTAYVDGEKAVRELNGLREKADRGGDTPQLDPYMTFGAIVSSALKKYDEHPGQKEKRVLLELSKLDMQMKTTAYDPWLIILPFLLRLSRI